MKRKAFLFAAAFLAAGPAFSFADDADVASGAVDPYDAGAERTRFLAAAGVDSELDESEFKASAEAKEPFARKFDSWATIKGFDRNTNGTIDWFEADGYRKALRDAVLLAYDKSKDGKLADEEREAANKDLAAGKAPRVTLPRRERPSPGGNDAQPNQPNQPNRGQGNNGNNGGPGNRGNQTPEERAATLKKYDADGDGELNREERDKARADQIEEWRKANPEEAKRFDERRAADEKRREEFTKKYDKDGNGELSDEERREGFRADFKERDPEGFARFEKQREEFTKKYDADGDGKLSDEERRTGFETTRKEFEAKMAELTKKYDADGDGRLSREEREELFSKERDNLPNFGPGGPGGPGGRGGPGGGGRGGQGGGQRGGGGNNAPRGNDL